MIYVLIYLIVTAGTVLYFWKKGAWVQALGAGILWPIIWLLWLILTIQERIPARCAWCGKSGVGSMHELAKWRRHYLEECTEHPLAKRVVVLEQELRLERRKG